MNWYVVHLKHNQGDQLINFFQSRDDMEAFVPKIERWYSVKGKKDYFIKDLYPNYVFIKTKKSFEEFDEQYQKFFQSIQNYAELLEYDDIYALSSQEKKLMERIFDDGYVVKHSVGNIVNSVLKVDEGPLVGLEDKVIKIDRHKRLATLRFHALSQNMIVPLEVVSKT